MKSTDIALAFVDFNKYVNTSYQSNITSNSDKNFISNFVSYIDLPEETLCKHDYNNIRRMDLMYVKTIAEVPKSLVETLLFLMGFLKPHLKYFYERDLQNVYGFSGIELVPLAESKTRGNYQFTLQYQSAALYKWSSYSQFF